MSKAETARRYGCSPRTLERWKAAGAPLDNPKQMRVWLAQRKHLPKDTAEALKARQQARRVKVASQPETLPTGAAAALRRLESQEAAAFRQMQAAMRDGDPIKVKVARDGWLRVSESLRKYDIAVEDMRRDASESIPRKDAERFTHDFVRFWIHASNQQANRIAPTLANTDAAGVCEGFKAVSGEAILDSLAALSMIGDRLPDWLLNAAKQAVGETLKDVAQQIDTRKRAMNPPLWRASGPHVPTGGAEGRRLRSGHGAGGEAAALKRLVSA